MYHNVTNATFYVTNSTFVIDYIPPYGSRNVSFNIGMDYGVCSFPSGVVAVSPSYCDECGNLFRPPVKSFRYYLNSSSVPSISITKSANRSTLYVGEYVSFNISVVYSRGSCENSVNAVIYDHFDSQFEVVDSAGGTVYPNNTIVWNVNLQDGIPWNRTLIFKVNESNPCACEDILENVVEVDAGEDCCGCSLNASSSATVLVECYNETVAESDKTATPSIQEVCRDITYNTTYVFARDLNWSDIWFKEVGNNGQTFPDGSTEGIAHFIVNGTCNVDYQITLGEWINLGFLSSCSDKAYAGTKLEIKYTLHQNNPGKFADWSYLNVTGYPNLCGEYYAEAVYVTVERPSLILSVDVPEIVNTCDDFNVTIHISKDGDFPVYNVTVYFNDTYYRYIGPTNITGISNESGQIQSFEPSRDGNVVYWHLGNLTSGGDITFNVRKCCEMVGEAKAWATYQDYCGISNSTEASDEPLFLTRGNVYIIKTPDVIFARTKDVTWKIYVVNAGNGTAHNVTVKDTLDDHLVYVNSSINGSLVSPTIYGRNVTWHVSDLKPNEKVVIQLNTTFSGCRYLNNTANATWGCCDDVCQYVVSTSRVEVLVGKFVIVKHDGDLIDECGGEANFTIIAKNVGSGYVYNASVIEELPNCLDYVVGSQSSTKPSEFDYYPENRTLVWNYAEMAPGENVTINFKVKINESCLCSEDLGVATARTNYTLVCGDYGTEDVKPFYPIKASPHLSVIKSPQIVVAEVNDQFNWTINVRSDGNYEAKNATLYDVLPDNVVFVSSNPQPDGSIGNVYYWKLPNMSVGDSYTINLTVRVVNCDEDKRNNATAFWGCCPSKLGRTVDLTTLVTRPHITLTKSYDIDTCGGVIELKMKNDGSTAYITNITEYLPQGYRYVTGSAEIKSSNESRTFTIMEPEDYGNYIVWNSSAIDRIYNNEEMTISFKVSNANCSARFCDIISQTMDRVVVNYTDSCGNLLSVNKTWNIYPKIMALSVKKEPKTPVVAPNQKIEWWVKVSSSNKNSQNVTIEDELGSAHSNITVYYSNGTQDTSASVIYEPDGSKKIIWTGQTVPQGTDTWVRRIVADVNASGSLDNNVTVTGYCSCGCIYSFATDQTLAARLKFTKVPDDTLTIGEYANFTITAEYWGYERYVNVTIYDDLPINYVFINSSPYPDSIVPITGGTRLVWDLGNFNGPRTVEIELITVVNNTVENQNGTKAVNVAYTNFENESGIGFYSRDTAITTIVEPDLAVDKYVNRSVIEAGDLIEFTLKVYHTDESAHDAYDVWINDSIPSKLQLISVEANPQPDLNETTGNNIRLFYEHLSNDSVVTIKYTVRVKDNISIGEVLKNKATLTWTSVNETGNESYERYGGWDELNDYNDTAYETVEAKGCEYVSIAKSVDKEKVTIGEYVNYTIRVGMPRVVVNNVWINDSLPEGLIYDGIVSFEANNETFNEIVNGNNVSWFLGDVDNTDGMNITIVYRAIVNNTLENQNGTHFENNVKFKCNTYSGVCEKYATSDPTLITEPDLVVEKSVNKTLIEAGDLIEFTLKVYHTDNSTHDAYDVWINDSIPSKLQLISVEANPTPDSLVDNLRVYYSVIPLVNDSSNPVIVNYTVRVDESVSPLDFLGNVVNLTWSSMPGYSEYERYGNFTLLNDYNSTSNVSVTVYTIEVSKEPDYDRAFWINDTLTYNISIALPHATIYNMTVRDRLPRGLVFDGVEVTPNVPFNLSVSEPNDGTLIMMEFGDYVDGGYLNITIRAKVADIPQNSNGSVISGNCVNVTWEDSEGKVHNVSDCSGNITVIRMPKLFVTKAMPSTMYVDGLYLITLTVENTGFDTCYDVCIKDVLPETLKYVNGSSKVNGLPVPDPVNNTWCIGELERDEKVTLKFEVEIVKEGGVNSWEVVNCAFANGTFEGNDINSNVACAEAIVAVKVPAETPLSVIISAVLITMIVCVRRRTI